MFQLIFIKMYTEVRAVACNDTGSPESLFTSFLFIYLFIYLFIKIGICVRLK